MIFSYQKLLQENAITASQLPASIQQAIAELELLDYDLSEETDDEEITVLKGELRKLDREITQLIIEELDDESDEDLPAQDIKAGLIHHIWQSGFRQVQISHLKKIGYPIPAGSK